MNVRTLCLGILSLGEASGYEIKKKIEGPFNHFYEASFGSIYPALTRLTEEGMVSCTKHAQANRPHKKVYGLTTPGRLAFLDKLTAMPRPDRVRSEFLVFMTFAELLPTRHLSRVLDEQVGYWRTHIAELEAGTEKPTAAGHEFVCGFGVAVYRAALAYTEENRYRVEAANLMTEPPAASPALTARNAQTQPVD